MAFLWHVSSIEHKAERVMESPNHRIEAITSPPLAAIAEP
jgi:hypothetical protein